MSEATPAVWVITFAWFIALILGDLYLNRRNQKEIGLKRSIVRSVAWISLGVLMGAVIWLMMGHEAGSQYFYGFLIEKSLSLDNIFVWGVILAYLQIPRKLHYTVLFWGVLGAIIFRTAFVAAGVLVIERFEFVLLLLGATLLYSAYSLLKAGQETSFDPENSRIIKGVEKVLPFTNQIYGPKLFIKQGGRRVATLLFFAICVVELTDILFAVDSVPAVLAVVRDPYIALASNISAILGLRALYFVFESIKDMFWLLNYGLTLILGALGFSLIFEPHTIFGLEWFGLVIPSAISLGFVITVLVATIAGSILIKKPNQTKPA